MVVGLVDGRCFIWSVVCGRSSIWSVVGGAILVWSVVSGFNGRCGRWSISNVVVDRCFAFFLVGGRFLFLRLVSGRCLNQYMVGGRWLMVDGLWSVVLYYDIIKITYVTVGTHKLQNALPKA